MGEPGVVSEFYAVCCRPFDGGGDGDFLLHSARKKYFSCKRTVKGSVHAVENGQAVHVRYRLGPNCFCWRKTCGRTALQEAFSLSGGRFRLVSHSLAGELLSAAAYDAGLHWIQTAYFDGDPAKPAVLLRRKENSFSMLKYDRKADGYVETVLFPCPMDPGSAAQSYMDGKAGEPQIFARTDAGMFCFCPAEEQKLRLSILKSIKSGTATLIPEWPEETETAALKFHVIPNDGAAPVAPPAQAKRGIPPAEDAEKRAPHMAVPGDGAVKKPASAKWADGGYDADHEIFSVDVARQEQPGSAGNTGKQNGHDKPGLPPKKYTVAARGLSGAVVHTPKLSVRYAAPLPGKDDADAGALPSDRLIPAKRIVVSSMESYLYFGKLINGLRQGQGRTQMKDGHTAYEGGYRDDLRDGFGVYYYKSEKICYVGGWKQNLRHGMGVAFGSKDGSIFVGNWKNGVATGHGSAFDMQGGLTYTGDWKDGMRHGHGTEYRNGKVLRTGEWYRDKFCSGYGLVDGGKPEDETK